MGSNWNKEIPFKQKIIQQRYAGTGPLGCGVAFTGHIKTPAEYSPEHPVLVAFSLFEHQRMDDL